MAPRLKQSQAYFYCNSLQSKIVALAWNEKYGHYIGFDQHFECRYLEYLLYSEVILLSSLMLTYFS